MIKIAKNMLLYVLVLVGLFISGCSYAIIKNRTGRPDGMTYQRVETMQPKRSKTVTIRKVNGKLMIVREEEDNYE